MIELYLSNQPELVSQLLGMPISELHSIVGNFDNHPKFGTALKGKLIIDNSGQFKLVHHFLGRKVYLTGEILVSLQDLGTLIEYNLTKGGI